MWKKIRAADVDAAKGQLSRKRTETLRTQAEELESLDAQLRDIDTFERVVAAFFEQYNERGTPLRFGLGAVDGGFAIGSRRALHPSTAE